jgi:cyclic pyranopterin phosphate synthase
MSVVDTLGRPLRSLRISVTDRCNLRCHYCMPEDDYVWLPRSDLLRFEEVSHLADLFGELGVTRIRLTGGEPLLRHDLPTLVEQLAAKSWVEDFALTTNGVLLADQAADLRRAGLHRLTVSLDTLRRERFEAMSRRDALPAVLEGIDAARRAGFETIKLDAVVTRGDNDEELVDLVNFSRTIGGEVRFIEYMDVGGATEWRSDAVVPRQEILDRLADHFGPVTPRPHTSSAPAVRFGLPDGTTFGVISSTTDPFCDACDRVRLTADGVLFLCLYAQAGTDLRRPLRAGATRATLVNLIRAVWRGRADRGAEERTHVAARGTYIPVRILKKDAHLEMHTRGG